MLENSHPGSVGTYTDIANWKATDFFFSKTDGWERFGFLGVFADYVLNSLQGDILEIGVGESSIYLSHVARKFNRNIYHCDIAQGKITNPLSVPGYLTKEQHFPTKEDMPFFRYDNSFFFCAESDKFFEVIDAAPIAFAFIDGDHNYEQVKKDFYNTVPLMNENGFICLHDTYPPSESYLSENACGDVFRLRQEIEKDDRFDCVTLVRGTAVGVGLTLVRIKPVGRKHFNE